MQIKYVYDTFMDKIYLFSLDALSQHWCVAFYIWNSFSCFHLQMKLVLNFSTLYIVMKYQCILHHAAGELHAI